MSGGYFEGGCALGFHCSAHQLLLIFLSNAKVLDSVSFMDKGSINDRGLKLSEETINNRLSEVNFETRALANENQILL